MDDNGEVLKIVSFTDMPEETRVSQKKWGKLL